MAAAHGSSLSFAGAAKIAGALHEDGERAKQVAEDRKRRAQFAFITSAAEKWVWITDTEQAYVPAKILKENPDGGAEVEVGVSQTVKMVKKAEIGPVILRVSDLKNSFEDMVRMGDVNEATILHNLKMRFMEDLIYTNIGTILVSINPFKWMEHLYKSSLIMEHLNTPAGEVAEPHVFAIAAAAYAGLRTERVNQSVIISGESGAGKTEATKQCLKFFAEAAGSSAAGMEKKLLSANPILEAFGNAKTVRNNNSSRFGKWMEVHFNGRAQICGSQIINYLLEKSRVAFQANGERNYHIFYQLCAASPPALREKLALGNADEYVFTSKSNCITVEGLNDVHEFKDLMEAFDSVEMAANEYEPMFVLVAALLHLSNVVFEAVDSDSCRMSGNRKVAEELKHAARLMGVEPDALKLAMEQKLIETRNERVRTPLPADRATDCRNSMAKAIYGRMFDWLVQRVNSAMTAGLHASANVIGVLDIFGFEIFEVNSFEQLCINFCNEKLQQHFNYHVFKAEEKCYKAEEIDYTEIKFVDNQDVLDLIERKPDGLLPRLDDEVKVPRGSDQGFLEKIQKMHGDNPRFKARVRRGTETRDHEFGVNHYAGTVTYDVRGFLEKNKDELMLNVRELLASSKEPFLQMIFSEENQSAAQKAAAKEAAAAAASGSSATPSKGGGGGGGSDKQSQSSQFRAQLDALMRTLNSTEPHYIRCIKPNSVKKGNIFDAPICLQQLRYAGVFEAVKVRQLGFPFRFTHEVFFKRYRYSAASPKLKEIIPKGTTSYPWKDKCREVLRDLAIAAPEHLDPVDKLFKFGRTMVLYRADQHRVLEMIRDHIREDSSRLCQRIFRGHMGRKTFKQMQAIRAQIREAIKSRDLPKVQAAVVVGRGATFQLFEMKALVVLEARLLEEKACRDQLTALYPVDPADHYGAYEAALKEADRLELREPIVESCRHKFRTVKDRIETKAAVQRAIALGDKAMILKSLAKAEELAADWGDILGAEIRAAASDTMKVIELEGQVQDDLRTAILHGCATGPIGALDASNVDIAGLQAAIAAATSGRVSIKTAMGQHLIVSARLLVELRMALKAGSLPAINAAVASAMQLRKEDRLVPEADKEVKAAEAELADKRVQNELLTALAKGGLPERVGYVTPRQQDVAGLAEAITKTKAAAEACGGLSSTAKHLLTSAELLLRLRQAFSHANGPDWANIKRVVAEGLEARLADPCVPELAAAKAELDNHIIVHQLNDGLERGSAVGTVARLDVSTIDITALTDRIAHAEELGVQTAQAAALLSLARIIRRVREALLRGETDDLLDIVKEAKDVPKEFTPAHTADELLVARYEGENALIVKTLSAAILHGAPKGSVGSVDKSSIDVKFLHSAVKKTNSMKCRSEEALWLLEVAENLVDLREAYVAGSWGSLAELVGGLRGLHGARPSERGEDYKRLSELPVLRSTMPSASHGQSRAPLRYASSTGAPTSHEDGAAAGSGGAAGSAGIAGLAAKTPMVKGGAAGAAASAAGSGSSPPQQATQIGFPSLSRGRGSSADKRPVSFQHLRAAMAGEHVSLSLHGPMRGMGRRTSIVAGAGSLGLGEGIVEVNGFELPPEVLTELSLIQDELHNHTTITELTAQLSSGGPVGELGALTGRDCVVDSLAIALKKAARAGFKTPLAASLAYTGTVIRDLRASLRDNDWKTVEATLKSVAANNARVARSLGRPLPVAPPPYLSLATTPGSSSPAPFAYMSTAALGPVPLSSSATCPPGVVSADMAGLALAQPGIDEIVRMEAELQYRRTMEQLQGALTTGAATGSVGALQTDLMDTDALAGAIDAARALGARTAQARHLTALCRLMWQMRTAVMEGDWPAVESLLIAGAPVLGTAPDGSSTLEPGCTVPEPVKAEIDLYKAEAHNRRIVETLKGALLSQAVQGEVGRLNLSSLDVSGLQDGVKMALQLGIRTPEARCLVATAVHVRAMRLALLGGQWEQLGSFLDYYSSAEAKSKPYSLYGRSMRGVQDAANATAAGSPRDVTGMRMVTTNTKDGMGSMGWWAGVVEPGLGSDARNGSLDIMIEGVAPESGPEAALLQLELNNRNVIVELTKALSVGAAVGSVGKLDVSTLRTGELDWALEYANRLGCATTEAETLLTTASIVRRIRLALGAMNWPALEDALTSARGKVLADVGAAEIAAAQDELDNRVILSEITSALARGRPQGRVGRLFTGSIEVGALNEAVGLATRLVPKTAEAKQMLFTAKVVARLRGCLLNEMDMQEASLTLEAIRGKLLATVALPEVTLVQDEVDNWQVCQELADALTRGGPGGDVGTLDTSTLDVTHLEAVLSRADEIGVKTSEGVSLYTAAAHVYKLRSALLRDDWEGSEEGIEALLAQGVNMPVTISDAAASEIELYKAESINRRMILTLSQGLAAGGARGPVGALDMSSIDTAGLDAAIATAVEAGPRTQEAERLLSAAKLIRRLRSVLLAGNWQWVGSVLLEARGMKSSFPPVSLKELQAAQDELDNRAVLAQLRAAMHQGGPSGGIGAMDVTSIDVQPLDDAVAYARALGVKSQEASMAVATSTLLRTVRSALRVSDFEAAKKALEEAKDKGVQLDTAATDELALVGMAVDNWVVVTALTDAVSSGSPQGPLGDADPSSIAVEALDAAIALTMKLGCNTVEARRCLVTGLIVRRLRQAFLDNDYGFLGQVVQEAAKEAEALLPPARRELAMARDTLEFRKVLESLKASAQALDEAGLGDALARAGALEMGSHPRTSVRETVETAAATLGRVQRVKAALTGATRALDRQGLAEALATAASLGYEHPVVEDARRTLARINEQADRASLALKGMDAIGMAAAVRDAEAMGLVLPVLLEMRKVLAMPRADFLRRELDAVLNSIAAEGMMAGESKTAGDASVPGASTVPSVPPFAPGRAPSSVEARVVNCTVQVKDLFFADAPNPDDVIAQALGGGAGSSSGSASVYLSRTGGRSGAGQGAAPNAAAQAAIAQMRTQRHVEDNIKGAQARVTGGNLGLPTGASLPLVLWTCPATTAFKANGLGRVSSTVSGLTAQQAAAGTIGTVVPPLHSPLRRQFALDKYPRLKPPHMFSSKFTPSTTLAESGLMRWSSEPLHTSLTLLASPEARKAAVRVFRHILAFMGDRPLSKPTVLAHDILTTGLSMPEVRDEILLQVAKQLTSNPSAASQERGWVLMYLALSTFPPSEELENSLEVWLREAGAVPCVWALHLSLYRGGPGVAGVPSPVEIGAALDHSRAPALPAFAQDGDSASSLMEYTSSGVLPLGEPDALGPIAHGATFLAGSLPMAGGRQTGSGMRITAADEDEHLTQLAFLQSIVAGKALPLPPAAAAIVANAQAQQQAQAQAARSASMASSSASAYASALPTGTPQGEKKPTPTKPSIASAGPGSSSASVIGGGDLPAHAQASMDRIAALLGSANVPGARSAAAPPPPPPAQQQGSGTPVGQRPPTPTRPGSSLSGSTSLQGPGGGYGYGSASGSMAGPMFSPVAKPAGAAGMQMGTGPRRPAPLPGNGGSPGTAGGQQGYGMGMGSASRSGKGLSPQGQGYGMSMSMGGPTGGHGQGQGHVGLDSDLEAKIASIARQLEDY